MRKGVLYIIVSLCLAIGMLAFVSAPEEPAFCLNPIGDVYNAAEVEGNICYSHSLPEGPEISCDHEQCGQCQAMICWSWMWPCREYAPE